MSKETCAMCDLTHTRDAINLCTPGANLPLCLGHWNRWLDAATFGPGTPSGVAAHLIREELNR